MHTLHEEMAEEAVRVCLCDSNSHDGDRKEVGGNKDNDEGWK